MKNVKPALTPADAKVQTSLLGKAHENEVTMRVCKRGQKKPSRKQTSPSDVKRRLHAHSRSVGAKAVRALAAQGSQHVTSPAVLKALKKRGPAPKPLKGTVKKGVVHLDVYQVFRDQNGVAYLRVGMNEKGAQFIVNKGFHVEMIQTNHHHARTALYLQPVVGASIIECVKRLLRPMNDQVTISLVAKTKLDEISKIKELNMKSTTKTNATKFSTVTAPAAKGKGKKSSSAPKGKKADTGERKSRLENQVVTLKKMPAEDKVPLQAFQICKVLKGKGGKTAVSKLVEALNGVVETKQPMTAIWAFYRGRLMKDGFIAITEA